jgi:hypothetical protein
MQFLKTEGGRYLKVRRPLKRQDFKTLVEKAPPYKECSDVLINLKHMSGGFHEIKTDCCIDRERSRPFA